MSWQDGIKTRSLAKNTLNSINQCYQNHYDSYPDQVTIYQNISMIISFIGGQGYIIWWIITITNDKGNVKREKWEVEKGKKH